MVDDFSTVHSRLRNRHDSALVQVHDDTTEHFEYWDQRTDAIDAAMLGYLFEQDFALLDVGLTECEVTEQEQGWVEFRRHDPDDVFGDGGEW